MQRNVLIGIIVVIVIVLVFGIYLVFSGSNSSNMPVTDKNGTVSGGVNGLSASGLKVEILMEGKGAEVKLGDTVTLNYVGSLLNGTKFDSSIDRNAPFVFPVGKDRVIKGFDEGVLGMKVGERRKLTIPPSLGYGSTALTLIPANSTLVYEVELLRIAR